jgi:hypothetical protein
MTKLGYVAAAIVLGASGIAAAAIPGWARQHRTTRVGVAGCASFAASAIRSVTGKTPTTTRFNASTVEIRSSTTNAGIFAYCTATTTKACTDQIADLTILTFSSAGSGDAAAVRDRVNTAFGNPYIIDCGTNGIPIME